MNYWLMKSEPETYSIDDLERDGTNMWEGCRNYTVRNFMRDKMKVGDLAFFYHSVCDPAGIVGIMSIASKAYADPTQFNPDSEYFDPKSPKDNPRWLAVDVKFEEKFERTVSLTELKANPKLQAMAVVQRGQRLSVMPVTAAEWKEVLKMAKNRLGG
ncbi:MAG: EVE domain-containing protein [Armatimonadetes bacterium]|nr:EVE domain-containing protein [Armatimonadota bacterium]